MSLVLQIVAKFQPTNNRAVRKSAVGRISQILYSPSVKTSFLQADGTSIRLPLKLRAPIRSFRHESLRRFSLSILLLILTCSTGCQTNSQQVVLEDRLRDQQSTIRDLKSTLAETKQMLAEQDRELQVARDQTPVPSARGIIAAGKVSVVSATAEQRVAFGSVAGLELHELTSGLVKSPEGEFRQLNLVLQPIDEDGELVKVAGELTIKATLVGQGVDKQTLAERLFPITESRKIWTRGLVSSGFHVTLPVNSDVQGKLQQADQILITASLNLGADRVYQTSSLLPVKP